MTTTRGEKKERNRSLLKLTSVNSNNFNMDYLFTHCHSLIMPSGELYVVRWV